VLSPDNATANTTNDHTLTFDAMNVSDDGNTDTFTVTVPSTAQLESANSATVTDANGSTVQVEGLGTSGNVVTIDVAPDSSADVRDLTVEANVTVTAPDVANTTTADLTVDVNDSSNGQDSANVTLTVEPAGPDTPDVPGVSENVSAAVSGGDGSFERQDILDMVDAYVGNNPIDGVELTREDVIAIVQFYVG
jgi:hypothetical protein